MHTHVIVLIYLYNVKIIYLFSVSYPQYIHTYIIKHENNENMLNHMYWIIWESIRVRIRARVRVRAEVRIRVVVRVSIRAVCTRAAKALVTHICICIRGIHHHRERIGHIPGSGIGRVRGWVGERESTGLVCITLLILTLTLILPTPNPNPQP